MIVYVVVDTNLTYNDEIYYEEEGDGGNFTTGYKSKQKAEVIAAEKDLEQFKMYVDRGGPTIFGFNGLDVGARDRRARPFLAGRDEGQSHGGSCQAPSRDRSCRIDMHAIRLRISSGHGDARLR